MEQINTINPLSWLEEEIQIDSNNKWEQSPILQYFIDQKKAEEIVKIIDSQNFTNKELESLISEIQLKKMKSEFVEYLDFINNSQSKIIDYLKNKWLLDINKKNQIIKFDFKWYEFEWFDYDLLDLIWSFSLNKWSFKKELKKVDYENVNYSLDIHISKDNKNKYSIENITINKK